MALRLGDLSRDLHSHKIVSKVTLWNLSSRKKYLGGITISISEYFYLVIDCSKAIQSFIEAIPIPIFE